MKFYKKHIKRGNLFVLLITIFIFFAIVAFQESPKAGTAIKYGPTAFNFTASSTYARTNVQALGAAAMAVIEIPSFTNAVTATFSIINQDGVVVYKKDSLSKGNTHVITDFSVNFPVDGISTLELALSDAPGSSGQVKITLYTMK